MSKPAGNLAERFFSHVEKTPTCWLWTAYRDSNGYGRLGIGRKYPSVLAHRVAFFLAKGRCPMPYAIHDCDNPPCVRIGKGHVVEGTPKKNSQDMVTRGRHFSPWKGKTGELHHMAKVQVVQVIEIRKRYAVGDITQRELGEEYGLSIPQISNIVRRAQWRDV
jgi:hypothetical protein